VNTSRAYRFRLDYDPLFQFLAQGQMSQWAVDYFHLDDSVRKYMQEIGSEGIIERSLGVHAQLRQESSPMH